MSAAPTRALKDFQVATVEHVLAHLTESDGPKRFLVADEVGLGKTLVAAEVVARTLAAAGTRTRADVIYLCSNLQIAGQNKRHLLAGGRIAEVTVDRLTRLPFAEPPTERWRLLALTPGTSFAIAGGTGRVEERAELSVMLLRALPHLRRQRRKIESLLMRPARNTERFRHLVASAERAWTHAERHLAAFKRELAAEDRRRRASGEDTIEEAILRLLKAGPWEGMTRADRSARLALIGAGRMALAVSALDGLRPVLVVMDEFQRFPELLAPKTDGEGDDVALARRLLDRPDVCSLLLSATPYRPPTGSGIGDDHHDDLMRTVSYLTRHDPAAMDEVKTAVRDLRLGLLAIAEDGGESAKAARDRVQGALRAVMCRTERLRATAEADGMLAKTRVEVSPLQSADVKCYLGLRDVMDQLDLPDPVEYWKSAPAVANGQHSYLLGRELLRQRTRRDPELAGALRRSGLIDFDKVAKYRSLDLHHPGWRWMRDQVLEPDAWRLLWIPPSLPSLRLSGPFADDRLATFTKRLVFSNWSMVPQLLSTLLSYEVERGAARRGGAPRFVNTAGSRSSHGSRLDFKVRSTDGAPQSMRHWSLLHPSFTLAALGDLSQHEKSADGPLPVAEARRLVKRAVKAALSELRRYLDDVGCLRERKGADHRWYWCAPVLLDWHADPEASREMLRSSARYRKAFVEAKHPAMSDGYWSHVEEAVQLLRDVGAHQRGVVGRMPADLADVLTDLALGGLGSVSLRAVARSTGTSAQDLEVRRSAQRVAWACRSLFSGPEAVEAVASLRHKKRTPYWRQVVSYSIAGDLASVLEEMAAVHPPDSSDPRGAAGHIADRVESAIGLRSARYTVTGIDAEADRVVIDPTEAMRSHFAVRLGGMADVKGVRRDQEVRDSFNSPFWPFVLTTTSVGQEGLDFHLYCHAVVHWNLPSSAVDLEQREGRVHRYLGHAVRRNVARAAGHVGRRARSGSWETMLAAVAEDRPPDRNDLVPWWVYTTGDAADARIERYVPALPKSKDEARHRALEESLGLYRMTFGQPRPDELVAFLGTQVPPDLLHELKDELVVDLSPPGSAARQAITAVDGVQSA